MNNIDLTDEEVLALDDYFSNKIGYIGHADSADEAMHKFVKLVGHRADDIRLTIATTILEMPTSEDGQEAD